MEEREEEVVEDLVEQRQEQREEKRSEQPEEIHVSEGSPKTPPDDLVAAAKEAFANAYAPYSGFRVGVALRDPKGTIHRGANVENASYGLSRCGEQSAIQALATAGERTFDEAVVYTEADEPASPCGACRQILFEFNPDALVLLVNHLGHTRTFRVHELLPHGFSLEPHA